MSKRHKTHHSYRIMSTWLYQYWFYCFKTAKNWGRGPREWNVESLLFSNGLYDVTPILATNLSLSDSDILMTDVHESNKQVDALEVPSQRITMPPTLCRWSIHCDPEAVEAEVENLDFEPDPNPDPSNEASWKPWPQSWKEPLLQKRLLDSLATNNFSNVKTKNLTIAIPQLIKASERSKEQFLEEAFGFSIMARNEELVYNLGLQLEPADHDKLSGHYPLHLATSFLDGSKGCSNILAQVLNSLEVRTLDVNALGHTILDNLMMTILKSHTSVHIGVVDNSLRDERRFPGEEVDICGRWDADSDCFRALVATGQVSIPFEWKHKFCHTSAQTIIHCIELLSSKFSPKVLFAHSGLFVRHCLGCGLKMELRTLHVVILIAFYLAESGCEAEDLFGVVAILLFMLWHGAHPLLTASISLSHLLNCEELGATDRTNPKDCDHQELNPRQLADMVFSRFNQNWSPPCRTGWNMVRYILRTSTAEWERETMPTRVHDSGGGIGDSKCTNNFECTSYFGNNRNLISLRSAIQTELLTYRRQSECDPWVSANFDMRSVENDLASGADIFLEGFGGYKMKIGCCWTSSPRTCEATDGDFSNLERNWSLLTVIPPPIC